ncbi:MAG: hypothetical protein Ta2E_10220 [Mycoplasmoidaceae bacterium]|nr:MAG: hypothetical protein Ta2E_10220 [Mycoplasmoidaceae bacterium]
MIGKLHDSFNRIQVCLERSRKKYKEELKILRSLREEFQKNIDIIEGNLAVVRDEVYAAKKKSKYDHVFKIATITKFKKKERDHNIEILIRNVKEQVKKLCNLKENNEIKKHTCWSEKVVQLRSLQDIISKYEKMNQEKEELLRQIITWDRTIDHMYDKQYFENTIELIDLMTRMKAIIQRNRVLLLELDDGNIQDWICKKRIRSIFKSNYLNKSFKNWIMSLNELNQVWLSLKN